jgi:hypothetical protein
MTPSFSLLSPLYSSTFYILTSGISFQLSEGSGPYKIASNPKLATRNWPLELFMEKSTTLLLAIASCAVCLPLQLKAQDDDSGNLSSDPHYRDELGVNPYTTPSIEHLFALLDSVQPIPWKEVDRKPSSSLPNDRIQYALSFGLLIANGFLNVAEKDSSDIELLGKELLRRAKGLGVNQEVTRHSEQLLDLAKKNDWTGLRKELILTQKDVEKAMLDLRDEQVAHLLSLGGWIRGLEISATAVFDHYTPERAAKIQQSDLLDYFQDRLSTMSPRAKKLPLIQKITAGIRTIQDVLNQSKIPSQESVKTIRDEARKMAVAID